MARWPSSAKVFLRAPTARRCAMATGLIQRDLAATLSAIAEQGPRGFYEGPVAEKLAKAVGDAGGIMTMDDLKSYQAVIRAPVRGNYRGYDIVSMPLPSSGGTVLLENAEHPRRISDVRDMKQGSAPSLHLMIEAMKRAYADRARYLGDPAFVNAPIAGPDREGLRAPDSAPASILERATPGRCASAATPPREGTQHHALFGGRLAAATPSATPTR